MHVAGVATGFDVFAVIGNVHATVELVLDDVADSTRHALANRLRLAVEQQVIEVIRTGQITGVRYTDVIGVVLHGTSVHSIVPLSVRPPRRRYC